MEDKAYELIDTLILEGALVIEGVDSETGQILYNFTDKLKEMAPELYYGFLEMLHQSIMSLWEQGFLEMDVTSNSPLVTPSEKSMEEKNWKVLNETDRHTLQTLMRGFRELG